MNIYMILFPLLGILYGKGEALSCVRTFNSTRGTIPESGSLANENCTYIIVRNSTLNNTMLNLSKISLSGNDTLVINDGNMLLANYTAASKEGPQIAVGFHSNVTITFTISGTSTQSSWTIDYDTEECKVIVDDLWTSRVDSPLYLLGNSSLSCTYIVNRTIPQDSKSVISFLRFEINGSSNLTVTNNNRSRTYIANSQQDDFFSENTNTFVVVFNVANTSVLQNFSLLVSAVSRECSWVEPKSPYSYTHSLTTSAGSECRWLFRTNGNELSILATVKSLKISSGIDRLTFISGGSSNGQVLATVTTDVKDSDYIIASPGTSMIVSLVFGNIETERVIDFSLTETAYGGRFSDHKILEFQNKADNANVYYQLIASPGQIVKVDVLSVLPKDVNVTFYNSLQSSDSPIVVLGNNTPNFENVIGHSTMLVKLTNFKNGSSFQANFTSIKPDCNLLYTSSSGQVSYSNQSEETCTLVIAPPSVTGTIILYIDNLKLGVNESVKIYSGLSNKTLIAHFIGPVTAQTNSPQIYAPVADRLSVVITRTNGGNTLSATLRYQTITEACRRKLAEPTDSILTPNYPNQYPLNANCIWSAGNVTKRFLYLSFQDLALAKNHTISGVNRTHVLFKYEGNQDQLPGDLVLDLTVDTEIKFQSSENINQVGRGVNITTRTLDCGGTFNGSGSFKAPTNASFCVWIINVAGSSTNIVNLTIDTSNFTAIEQFVNIFDGNSTRAGLLHVNATKIEGLLSRYSTLVLVLNTTEALKSGLSFNFTTKTCTELCQNGICLHADWRCNSINDCGDNTDEINCTSGPTTPSSTTTAKPSSEGHSGWVKAGWVPGCLFLGVLLGVLLVLAIPRIIARLRSRGRNYSRMEDNTVQA